MNKFCYAALLALAAPLAASASPETIVTGPRNADILAVADAFDRAQLTQDRATLERMVDEGLVFIQSNGEQAGKKAFIDGWTTPGDIYDPVKLVDRVVIRLGPDAFMVSAATTLTGTSGGKRFSSSFRFTDTFRRIAGEWRAIHIQVTRTAG
ncbi:MAG TPA: nuclear transport factor 2 family protein [Sphingomonas sp.]|nr:nuclear transport factor 2 family protein [Sphingomonas sp.]